MKKNNYTDMMVIVMIILFVFYIFVLNIQVHIKIKEMDKIDSVNESIVAQEIPEFYFETDNEKMLQNQREQVVIIYESTEQTENEPVIDWYIDSLPLDLELQEILWNSCQEFGIDYRLALAVIEVETGYSNIFGDGGDSVGYFQIQPRWWGELMESIGATDLTDPVDNFRTGCAVLRELLLRYDGSVTDALTAYNSGHPGESVYADAVMERAEEWW